MEIVNQMIEDKENGGPTTQAATDPHSILNTMTDESAKQDGAAKEPTAEEKQKTEDAAKAAELAVENQAKKEADALKEKDKAEKKDIQLDEAGQPKLDELGDKVKADAAPVEKDWWEKEEPKADTTEKGRDETKQKELNDKLARLAELETLLADPETEAFVSAKKLGKGIKDFYNEVVGTDYDSLSPEALYELKLKRNGLQGEELEEEIAAFATLRPGEKRIQTNDIKAQLKAQQSENLKKFSVDAKAQEEVYKARVNKQLQEADAYAKQIVGQKRFGIEITPEIAYDVKQAVSQGLKEMFNEDGSINLANFSDSVILYKHREAIVAASVKKALHKGKGEVLAEVTRASKNETVNRVPDEKNAPKTEYDRVGSEFYNQYAKK